MANAPTPGSPPTPLRVAGAAAANRALHARSVGLNAKYGLPKERDIVGSSPKPPKAPAVKAKAAAPATDPYTAAAMAQIQPELLGLKQQQQYADQQNLAYQGQLTNFYKALGGLLQGQAPAVSAAYNSAANAVGGLAQGLTGDARTQMDAQNAQAQAILARGGQTQASDYMAGKAAPGDAALNPFYSVHGLIPGTTLATQGAANAANAAAQPGIWAARGGDALTEAISKAVQGDQQWQQKIADVYAKVPALRQQILTTAQDMELKQRQIHDTEVALGIKQTQVKVDAVKAQQTYQAHMASVRLQAQKLNAQIANWNAQLQNKALDRQTRVQLQQMRDQAMQQRIQLQTQAKMTYAQWAKANGISTSGGSSKAPDWGKTSAAIGKQAEYLFNHPVSKKTDPLTGATTGVVHQQPQAVFNELWSQYVNPYLQTVPANQRASARATAKRAVLNAMAAAGFKLPGKRK